MATIHFDFKTAWTKSYQILLYKMGFKYYIKSRLMPFNQRHRVIRTIMGLRLHVIIICASSLLETSTRGYRIPPPPPLPFLDLNILHNTAKHFQDVGTISYGMYNNNLQPSTQKILHTLLQEIVKLDMLSKEQKSYNWRKLVSILK